jgi:K+-sensing histidine kinase KdpD
LLSDHVFSIFGRTLTITTYEQIVTYAIVLIVATVWAVQQFRRKRTVVLQRSAVSDQALYELSRIADALDRIANRPADQLIAAASNRQTEESTGGRIPLSIFGR